MLVSPIKLHSVGKTRLVIMHTSLITNRKQPLIGRQRMPHFAQAAAHYHEAVRGREHLRDTVHGGVDDPAHAKALATVIQKRGDARQNTNRNRPLQQRRRC